MMNVTVVLSRRKDKNRFFLMEVKRSGKWRSEPLWTAMPVHVGDPKVPEEGCLFCRPVSRLQKMWDALVVSSDPSCPIDVVQMTIGDRHDVPTEEFRKLFAMPQFRGRRFRFLMIRAVLGEHEVTRAESTDMNWDIVGPRAQIQGFPQKVKWCEVIVDCELELAKFLTSKKLHPSRPIMSGSGQQPIQEES
jgi:hypothetical protein